MTVVAARRGPINGPRRGITRRWHGWRIEPRRRGRRGARCAKGSLSVEQPVPGDEVRAIKRYRAIHNDSLPWLFVSERQTQLSRQAISYITRLAGDKAKLGRVWPHMLRHSCGYYLADQGTDLRTMQDYLGHRDPKHTAHYTALLASVRRVVA